MWVLSVALVVSMAGALGIVRATQAQLDEVTRVDAISEVLSPPSAQVENILLVGSDSREGADPNDEDFATTGSADTTPGMRSDTLIVVRIDKANNDTALMSVPRDLWVKIGDGEKFAKINAAYSNGPDVLVRTVQRALNIPIHHYVEINFAGFKTIVDAIGGVNVCVPHISRDKATGFYIGRKGCKLLDGTESLAYARSRYLEQKINGKWVMDRSGDTGRGERQRAFISSLAKDAARYLARNPLKTHVVLDAVTSAVTVNAGLDVLDMGQKLRALGTGDSLSYALPVSSEMLNDNFIFRLSRDATPVLAYFAGLGPVPATEDS
jgi:polyisoprenyl-teichoic acid--peptidoglycan teichoic acid transferase